MNKHSQVAQALSVMKENGRKYTKKRESMLVFLARKNRYVSAKEVQEYLKQEFSGISFDTIYRNLNDCAELNILEKTEFDGEMRYRIHCEPLEQHHHHHFICTCCGKTIEIDYCPLNEELLKTLGNVAIEGHRFEIFGKCEECIGEHQHEEE